MVYAKRPFAGPQAYLSRYTHRVAISNSRLLANNLALARELLHVTPLPPDAPADEALAVPAPTFVCTHCGHAMVVLQVFFRDCSIRAPPAA